MSTPRHDLAVWLRWICLADPSWPGHDPELADYRRRNAFVHMAIAAAIEVGFQAGFALDPNGEPGFRTVAYIELPTGQVSWHMPEFAGEFDGHSTADKYRRIDEFAEQMYPRGFPGQRVTLEPFPGGPHEPVPGV